MGSEHRAEEELPASTLASAATSPHRKVLEPILRRALGPENALLVGCLLLGRGDLRVSVE